MLASSSSAAFRRFAPSAAIRRLASSSSAAFRRLAPPAAIRRLAPPEAIRRLASSSSVAEFRRLDLLRSPPISSVVPTRAKESSSAADAKKTCRHLSSSAPSFKPFRVTSALEPVFKWFRDRRRPVVSVIKLHGLIAAVGGNPLSAINVESTQKLIERAFAAKDLRAVLLAVNSPGGSPVQSELVAELIIDAAREKNVKVVAFVEDYAASGGYWLACAADHICVARASVVGSVGVVRATFGLADLIGRVGVERRVIKAGKSKNMLDPFLPTSDEETAAMTRMCEQVHQLFKEYVRLRRGSRLKGSDETLFNGDVWIGNSAVELGLADEVISMNAYIRREYGDTVQVKRFKIGSWQNLLGGQTSLESSSSLTGVVRLMTAAAAATMRERRGQADDGQANVGNHPDRWRG